jgi:DNA-binding winged helix-turn-helix (wHTH) protein
VNDLDPTTRLSSKAASSSLAKHPVLTVLQGESVGRFLELTNDRTIIGRGEDADIVLKDGVASRKHAEIVRGSQPTEFLLSDLSSTNGTLLNGTGVESGSLLRDGDKIRIGKHLLKFSLFDDVEIEALRKTRPAPEESKSPRAPAKEILIFAPFHLPPDVDLLYRDEAVVPLEPRAVRVLRYLVENSERVVSKDELLEAVWPDVFTTDGVLKKAVSQVRRALCDEVKSAQFIETYHRRGYRFIAPVRRRVKQHV